MGGVVVGVGDPDGVAVTLGVGRAPVVQAPELITMLDGLVVERTFSVGSSDGARENALDF